MDSRELNDRIVEKGGELLGMPEGGKPDLFVEGRWVGKIMGWAGGNAIRIRKGKKDRYVYHEA